MRTTRGALSRATLPVLLSRTASPDASCCSFLSCSSHLLHATSGGRLSLHSLPSSLDDAATTTTSKIRLPANLTTLRPSADGKTFAYAGKEVDVSLWDLERALAAPPSAADADATASKKRKAGKAKENEKLLPGEIWRAKNVRLSTIYIPWNLRAYLSFPLSLSLSPSRSPTTSFPSGPRCTTRPSPSSTLLRRP